MTTQAQALLEQGEPPVESTSTATDRIDVQIDEGVVCVFGDCHYDGPASTAHRAVVKFCRDYQPDLVICVGDALDAAALSKHPRIMWEDRPSSVKELALVQQRLREIERASPSSR